MIHASTIQNSKVVVILEPLTSPWNNYYTWVITDRNSFQTWTFSADDTSTSPYYQSFTFSIGTWSSMTGSIVLDIPATEYEYKVYEMPTQYDLDITNSTGLVGIGILRVEGTSSIATSFTASDDSTIKVFTEL